MRLSYCLARGRGFELNFLHFRVSALAMFCCFFFLLCVELGTSSPWRVRLDFLRYLAFSIIRVWQIPGEFQRAKSESSRVEIYNIHFDGAKGVRAKKNFYMNF